MGARGSKTGAQQRGKTDTFKQKPNESVRPGVHLPPGTPEREAYEFLVSDMGVSGAEVLRRALVELYQTRKARRSALKEAG
ncbi:hypothetical protein ACWDBD_49525 [Streptomyces sp. NPDC001118]